MGNILKFLFKSFLDHFLWVAGNEGGWWYAIGQGAGIAGNAVGGYMQTNQTNRKIKNAMSDYVYTPYSGAKPPTVDYTDPATGKSTDYLRGAQKQDYDLTMNRSLGNDVGYDPSWMTSASALLKNQNQRALDDRLRTTSGSLSASGLSGNPRAYEATSGRAQRDSATDLQNSMLGLNIQNMEASRDDKNSATNRLAALNQNQFGQENTVANFDQNTWKAEEAAKENRQSQALGAALDYRDPWAGVLSNVGTGIANSTSMGMGSQQTPSVTSATGGSGTSSSSSAALGGGGSGYGLMPSNGGTASSNFGNYYSNAALSKYKNYTM